MENFLLDIMTKCGVEATEIILLMEILYAGQWHEARFALTPTWKGVRCFQFNACIERSINSNMLLWIQAYEIKLIFENSS